MKQPDLYYIKTIKRTSRVVKIHREYSPAARILHIKFDWARDVIFMVSK